MTHGMLQQHSAVGRASIWSIFPTLLVRACKYGVLPALIGRRRSTSLVLLHVALEARGYAVHMIEARSLHWPITSLVVFVADRR